MTTTFSNYGYAVTTANALRIPDAIALSYRGQQFSFSELNSRVNVTANALLALGVKPGDKVAVLIHDALPIAQCYLALAKIGAVIVALNPYWTDEVMLAMLKRCKIDASLTQAQDSERIAAMRAELPESITWLQLEAGDLPANTASLATEKMQASDSEPETTRGGDDPLAYFFTSGTTGLPKAVVHTHNSCRSMADIWLALPRDEHSVWGTGTIIWGVGFPCTIGAALYVGMRVALEDDFGPQGLLDAITREPISHFCVIPSFFSDLLANHDHQNIDLSSISVVLLGGEPLPTNLLNKIKERIPDAALYAFYGQTEAPYTCFGRLDDGSQAANVAGLARPGCAAQVLDANGNRVTDVIGELAVTGGHCMQCYFDQPEKTAEDLRDGWFFSGDIAVQDKQGRITVLGRREDAIQRAGHFVQPLDIEDAAIGIAGVTEAGAVGVDREGTERAILLAVTTDSDISEAVILQQLQRILPAHAVPDRVVIAEELPHSNDNSGGKGKLLRKKISEQFAHLLVP
ncbi:Long-chain-fatty-acid--CoA ligase [Halioglobus japonicus]|nr:Long-chain-fatty-acid--CoA ligase [Halioglobus japonicus]